MSFVPNPECKSPSAIIDSIQGSFSHTPDWQCRVRGTKSLYICRACGDNRERPSHHAKQHEDTVSHQNALRAWRRGQKRKERETAEAEAAALQASSPAVADTAPSQSAPDVPVITNHVLAEDALRSFLVSAANDTSLPLYPTNHPLLPASANPSQQSPSPVTGIDWLRLQTLGNTTAQRDPFQLALANFSKASLNILNGEEVSDDLRADFELLNSEYPSLAG